MSSPQSLPEVVLPLIPFIPMDIPIWLVGGAVRDQLLMRVTYDADFTVDGDAIRVARTVADQLGGKYYTLDKERGTGRVVAEDSRKNRLTLDFSRMRGEDIHADLLARDFTINAMAVSLTPPFERSDPSGGVKDLRDDVLRVCSPSAIADDPVRALRAVRFATMLGLKMSSDTIEHLRDAGLLLVGVSPERIRDELMHILRIPQPGSAFRLLDHFRLLTVVFPELESLRNLTLSSPITRTALENALSTIDRLGELLDVLSPVYDPELAANIILAQATLRLGRFRKSLQRHMERDVASGNSSRQLIFLAALYYNAGLGVDQSKSTGEKPGIDGVERESAELLSERAHSLRLSKIEIDQLRKMLLSQNVLAQLRTTKTVSPRAIYRFFKQTEHAGVEAILLDMAAFLAAQSTPAPPAEWEEVVELARELFSSFFETYEESIAPRPLLNGGDLMQSFDLKPGPQIGRILELLQEAQVADEIQTREEALEWVRSTIDSGN
jgi:poly(A) polymerase